MTSKLNPFKRKEVEESFSPPVSVSRIRDQAVPRPLSPIAMSLERSLTGRATPIPLKEGQKVEVIIFPEEGRFEGVSENGKPKKGTVYCLNGTRFEGLFYSKKNERSESACKKQDKGFEKKQKSVEL